MLKIIQKEEELSFEELRKGLFSLARELLTKRQKHLLVLLASYSATNITRLIPALCAGMHCSPTTVWRNVNLLKSLGLVDFGDADNKGKPLRLTRLGFIILSYLKED